MATWMAHLRVASGILAACPELAELEYIMGNIAPDSGEPTADWSSYVPSKAVSHYRIDKPDGSCGIRPELFAEKYLTPEAVRGYSEQEFAFYLGYYDHLMTDVMWHEQILDVMIARNPEAYREHKYDLIWKWKGDWYDLDFLYLEEHPDFKAFQIYQKAEGFKNTYLDFFSEEAFDRRRVWITGFYQEKRENLHREYPYLNPQQMDDFVEYAVRHLLEENQRFLRYRGE